MVEAGRALATAPRADRVLRDGQKPIPRLDFGTTLGRSRRDFLVHQLSALEGEGDGHIAATRVEGDQVAAADQRQQGADVEDKRQVQRQGPIPRPSRRRQADGGVLLYGDLAR